MSEIVDQLWLYSPTGVLQQPGLPLTAMDWTLEENTFGTLTATGPLNEIDPALFVLDARFEVHRFLNGQSLGIEGNTQFMLRFWEIGEDDSGAETWRIEAYTPEYFLRGRFVDSYASTPELTNPLTTKTDQADDMVKAFVSQNIGTTTSLAVRKVTEITIDADLTLGPSITISAAWKNLYSTIQDIALDSAAQGHALVFGFEKTDASGTGFTFRVWLDHRGVDRTSTSISVSKLNGNLRSPSLYFDHRQEVTAVRSLGKGEGATRKTQWTYDSVRSTASPFAYMEKKIESTQAPDDASLLAVATAELRRGRPQRGFSGKFVDTDYLRYGVGLNFGDIITAEYKDESFPCKVWRVRGSYSVENAEVLDIDLEWSNL